MPIDILSGRSRGVLCRHCGKPVRIPRIVSEKESGERDHHAGEGEMHYELVSRTFVLRCRSCERESIYAINQIVDIPAAHLPAPGPQKAASAAN